MALITLPTILVGPSVGLPGDVHSEQRNPLGTEREGPNGEVYVYLPGVASVVYGSWVTFDEDFVTTRTVANAQGRVAIATGAVDATTEYGWFQIAGKAEGLCLADFADNGKVYLTSTAGQIDDADVGGDFVVGAIGRSARDTTTGTAIFQLDRPIVQDTAFD